VGYSPQELADRAEIHDVIVRYGWAIDTKDWALLDTCFTADAEVDYSSNPGGKKGPYQQIRSWLEKMISAFPVTQHLMSNIDAKLDGDRATCRTMVTNPQGAATREGGPHFFFVGARYDDELVRTDDGWKIAKRVETTLWFQGSLPPELLIER
jgi:SnoaL-like domain